MDWEEKKLESTATLAALNTYIKIRMAVERPMRMARKKLLIHLMKDGICVRLSKTKTGEVQVELLDTVRHTYGGRYVLAGQPIAGLQNFYAMRFVSGRLEEETPTVNHCAEPSQRRGERRYRRPKTR